MVGKQRMEGALWSLVVLVVSSLLAFLLNGLGICSHEFVATNEEDCQRRRRRPVRIPPEDFVHDYMVGKQRMEGALSSPGHLGLSSLLDCIRKARIFFVATIL